MILKYRVAVAIATMENKPDNRPIDQHINILRSKVTMDCDSDMTVCSDDFQINDDKDHGEAINLNRDEIITGTHDSENILEGYNLVLVHGNGEEFDAIMKMKTVEDDPKIDEGDDKMAYLEQPQSQNLLEEFEILQSGLTFYRSGAVNGDEVISGGDDRQNVDLDNNINVTDDSQQTEFYSIRDYINYFNTHLSDSQTQHVNVTHNQLYKARDNINYINRDANKSKHFITQTQENPIKDSDANEHLDLNVKDNEIGDMSKEHINQRETFGDRHINGSDQRKTFGDKDHINQRETFGDKDHISQRETFGDKHINLSDQRETFGDKDHISQRETFGDKDHISQRETFGDCKGNDVRTESKDTQTQDAGEDMDGMDIDELDNEEVVPFKVVEELNRVKTFLDKRNRELNEECAPDSGYRSDSQKRSHKGSAVETKWLNRSAQCMVDYLATCAMVPRAKDIISDVSSLLGRVIDRLHTEERYPAFIEGMLDLIQKLLKDICENDGSAEDALLHMDEKISRLLLLNTSHHIIKYTIEKIIIVLEKLHARVKEETVLEVDDVNLVESAFYVLHALEVLLRRYSETVDSGTQPSQEDRLKRSTITDMWRRKWITRPDVQVAAEERTVVSRCTETLNRLIVDAVSRYSLLSFAALQCFNLLKN